MYKVNFTCFCVSVQFSFRCMMAASSRPSVQPSEMSEGSGISGLTDLSRCQSDVSAMTVPGLDLSMLRESSKLGMLSDSLYIPMEYTFSLPNTVRQVHRTARESVRSRRQIPRSSRVFNEIKTSALDRDPNIDHTTLPLTARSPSCDTHRQKRVPLSGRYFTT